MAFINGSDWYLVNFLSSQIYTEMYSLPNGDSGQEVEEGTGDAAEWKSEEETEESEENSSGEEVESPPRVERRSKEKNDPGAARPQVGPSGSRTPKRTRTTTPEPAEKTPKQPKVTTTKPRRALPRIKVDVPIASA